MTTARVQSPAEFLFAGKAEFTLRSVATGAHFTYKVTQNDTGSMFFVALLQDGRKQYAGCIPADARTQFRTTRASKVSRDHAAIKGFEWFLKHLDSTQVELHHCGKCGRCGRKLTNPESITRGIGPECATKGESVRGSSALPVQRLAPLAKVAPEIPADERYTAELEPWNYTRTPGLVG